MKSNPNKAEKFESLGKYTKKNGCLKCCLLILKDISAQAENETAELIVVIFTFLLRNLYLMFCFNLSKYDLFKMHTLDPESINKLMN